MTIYTAADIAHSSSQVASRQIQYCSPKISRAWFVGGWQLSHPGPVHRPGYQAAHDTIWREWGKFWDNPDKDAVAAALKVIDQCFTGVGGDPTLTVNLPVWWAAGTGNLILGNDANFHFDMATHAMKPLVEAAVAKAVSARCDLIVFDNEAPGFFQNINLGMPYQRGTVQRHRWQNQHARDVCHHIPMAHWCTVNGATGNPPNPSDPAEAEFLAESDKARQFNDYSVAGVYGSIGDIQAEVARVTAYCRRLSIEYIPSMQVDDGVTAEWMMERLSWFAPRVSRLILWAPGEQVMSQDVLDVVARFA